LNQHLGRTNRCQRDDEKCEQEAVSGFHTTDYSEIRYPAVPKGPPKIAINRQTGLAQNAAQWDNS
jgi:hypothetical protein